jgi:purine-binding chemotaxis protein CheW
MSNGSDRLLLFTIGENRYALDLHDIAEVLTPPSMFPVPWAPPYIKGTMNFHGSLVAVVDLADFLQIGATAPDGTLLVLDRTIASLALWIDRVENIVPGDGVQEENESSDPLVQRVLFMGDVKINKLAVATLLERVEKALKR